MDDKTPKGRPKPKTLYDLLCDRIAFLNKDKSLCQIEQSQLEAVRQGLKETNLSLRQELKEWVKTRDALKEISKDHDVDFGEELAKHDFYIEEIQDSSKKVLDEIEKVTDKISDCIAQGTRINEEITALEKVRDE